MASFTDEISKFNPYVAQLPVDTMYQVGMAKQKMYDQGVQKIQTKVDNILGMDVYKPEHKQYLQSKFDELGSKLKTVAAGDFSNAQLVNSVGGMAGSIIKDPIVQNAVYSTQKIRKGDSEREVARKAGKTSPNNDQDWNDQKASWLNDKSLESPFSGNYNEFYDYDKVLMEKADKILSRPDEYITDNPWQRDEQGRTKYFYNEVVKDAKGKTVIDPNTKQPVTRETYSLDPSKGKEKVDDAMLKLSIKGTSASKLFNNFLDSIDSRAAQQLRIDAKAKYRGITAEAFTKDIVGVYENKKKFQSQEIVNTAVALKNPDLTSVEKATLKARLNQLQTNEKDGVIDKELNATLQALQKPENLDKYKTDIYTQQRLMSMATDMATKSYKQEIADNPYFNSYMKKQNFILDQKKFADESRYRWSKFDWDKYTWTEDFKFKTEKENREWLEKHPEPVVLPGTLSTDTTPPTITIAQEELVRKADVITAVDNKFADRLFSGMTPDQIRAGYNQLLKDYDTNPKADYSPDQLAYLQEHKKAESNFVAQANLVNAAKRKVNKFIETEVGSKVASVGGYTGADIVDAGINIAKFKTNVAAPGAGYGYDEAEALKYFQEYKGGRYLPLLKAHLSKGSLSGVTPEQKQFITAMDNARKVMNEVGPKAKKVETDYLSEHNPMAVSQRSALNMANAAEKAAIDKFLTGKASEEISTGGKSASTVLGWEKPNDTKFEIQKYKDGSTKILAISADGKSSQVIEMKTEEQNLFPKIKKTSIMNQYVDVIANSEKHTTNIAGQRDDEVDPTNAVNAGITGYDVPLLANDPVAPLVRFDIEGNPDNSGEATDGYSVIMYVHPPGSTGWKGKRMHKGYVPAGGVVNVINGISNVGVQQAMKTWK
jgi:hypothetical protein